MTTTTETAKGPSVKVLILRAAGTNCDDEAQVAFEQAGATCERLHINALFAAPQRLHEAQILVLPGGFSYGDDIHSGKVLATELRQRLGADLKRFLAAGKLILGICNGFQVLVKTGLIPLGAAGLDVPVRELPLTLTWNRSGHYECRWTTLRVAPEAAAASPFLTRMERLHVPVAHAEGRLIAPQRTRERLAQAGQVAFQYTNPHDGRPTQEFPHNPNGSDDAIAGLMDPSGQILGLMPHPERAVLWTQLPEFSRRDHPSNAQPPAMTLFRNAVQHAANLTVPV